MEVECVSCDWAGQLSDTDETTVGDEEHVPVCPKCGDPVSVAFIRAINGSVPTEQK